MTHALAQTTLARCDTLAAFSEEADRLTRPSLTTSMREAHDAVAGWMRAAGMLVREDEAANLIGRYEAEQPGAPTLLLGSHLDSVRDAGRYDGPLGVLIALACVEQLAAAQRRLPFAIEVIAFTDEEGLRFPSFTGSRAVAGKFPLAWLDRTDSQGIALREALLAFGGDPEHISAAAYDPTRLLGYCEVHIEQGPLLEAQNLPVGVVSAITGLHRVRLSFVGVAGHAGTTPMDLRKDALCAAAELVLAAESLARQTPGLVITVGEITVEPGVSNVIPGVANLTFDLRHQDDTIRSESFETLINQAKTIARQRQLQLGWQPFEALPAVPCDPTMRAGLRQAIIDTGYPAIELPSGAGHDAAIIASICPAAMLFVRCIGGISHNPAEAVTLEDVAIAISVLSRYIDRVSSI
jgi:allantoate deiminase